MGISNGVYLMAKFIPADVAAGAACGIGVSKQSGAFRFKSIGGRP